MNKATRMLAMSGMAIAAGATIGAGAANAAPATPATAVSSASSSSAQAAEHRVPSRASRVVGYYRSASACYRAGRVGEMRNRWDDYRCVRVRSGFHRSSYALTVRWDNHGHGQGGPGHFPGGPGNGPGFPGNGPGFPGGAGGPRR